MKNKVIEYSLAGVVAGITIYVLMRWWNDHKRKSAREEEELAKIYRKKYPHEFGEYTL
jgi:hypothetical protein